jgi:hypothetical protein
MHKIAFESKGRCKLLADGSSSAGVDEVGLERYDRTCALLNILLFCGAISQPVGGS